MSATPAEQLARLRVTYGLMWRIDRQAGSSQEAGSGPGWSAPPIFVAVERTTGRTLTDTSADGLESKITRVEPSRDRD